IPDSTCRIDRHLPAPIIWRDVYKWRGTWAVWRSLIAGRGYILNVKIAFDAVPDSTAERRTAVKGSRPSHMRKAIPMERFPVHTIESAPEASKSALGDVQARFGMIPNLAGAMATSPVLIQSFIGIFDKVHGGNFTEVQIQAVLLTDAVTNKC